MNKTKLTRFIYLSTSFTPKILLWVYWASILVTVYGGVHSMFATGLTFALFVRGLFIIVFGLAFLRVSMEFFLVFFKIEQHLKQLIQIKNNNQSIQEKEK